ncbi:hypothetical protein COU58_00740 [Candidatus Pacearchaeota archaeon CG10_big_fil_rev_8_21_14_0_10_32_42]|nr:MAG: hypothetical protein COU58_00740 [Candidatus Pacearchaeota archaeon CG10_big_fil_rev_8_21_14_0_10_32_42]
MEVKTYYIKNSKGNFLVGDDYSDFARDFSKKFNSEEFNLNSYQTYYNFRDSIIFFPDYSKKHKIEDKNKIAITSSDKDSIDKRVLKIEEELDGKYKLEEVKRK